MADWSLEVLKAISKYTYIYILTDLLYIYNKKNIGMREKAIAEHTVYILNRYKFIVLFFYLAKESKAEYSSKGTTLWIHWLIYKMHISCLKIKINYEQFCKLEF